MVVLVDEYRSRTLLNHLRSQAAEAGTPLSCQVVRGHGFAVLTALTDDVHSQQMLNANYGY